MLDLYIKLILVLLLSCNLFGDSGGILNEEQAAYDVKFYDLSLSIDPDSKTIAGNLTAEVEILNDLETLVLDLHDQYNIDSVMIKKNDKDLQKADYTKNSGKLNISIPENSITGDNISCTVYYDGAPVVSSSPPWMAGFVWNKTPSNDHWVGVACQYEGGDLWWPCKDHPSDEPDSMALHFTVPDPYICASNGKLLSTVNNDDNTITYNWHVSTPINNYNVTLYIADFKLIEDEYISVSGDTIPFKFWILPEDYEKALNNMDMFKKEFDFLESVCGPFPFYMDKHGWAHSPYWGMEHQTIIAYNNNFYVNKWGYDYIHLHELTHEWWGNLITGKDWSDLWIHEGLGTYMEALYVEHLYGIGKYFEFLKNKPGGGSYPLAPFEPVTAEKAFGQLNTYTRGSQVMHTLRYYLGDEDFFRLLKYWTYSGKGINQYKLFGTDDMKDLAEELLNKDLDPFFTVFFREASLPLLKINRKMNTAEFSWNTENNVKLDLNVPVTINGEEKTVSISEGKGIIDIASGDELKIDPNGWILMKDSITTSIEDEEKDLAGFELQQNYPNPFNPVTTINYSVGTGLVPAQNIKLSVYNSAGQLVKTLINKEQKAGNYSVEFNGSDLNSGIYYYKLTTPKKTLTNKMILIK